MRRIAPMLLMGLGLTLAAVLAGQAAVTYAIDQRFGEIGFSVRHLGLFRSHGVFDRFHGELTIDETHPENTRVDVTIDTGSVRMNWAQATAMLRSAPYFNVARYPEAHYRSTRVLPAGEGRYDIEGLLDLRGVTQPVLLHAALVGRHPAPDGHAEIAEFVITGQLRRSMFGMTANPTFVSDRVALHILARVRLEAPAHAG
jgi:polyisoprenoid-binding protein YceI